MPQYLGNAHHQHDAPERTGVLLVNLGTPSALTVGAVRRFLAEFLADPRVIETPRWLWRLILHGVILRIRPRRSLHAYQQIWTPQGSPLMVYSQALTAQLRERLRSIAQGEVPIALAMTYGEPSIPQALAELNAAHVRRVIVLPLYPQYSGSTTGSVFDRLATELKRWRWVPEVRFIGQYHDDPSYIEALASHVRQYWETHERNHLLFSFHGLPKHYLVKGDPYFCHCHKTARLLTQRLGLQASDWSISFQSRVGRGEWLRPYTDELLLRYGAQGPKRVTVICPGFATDCLETLEEIALRNGEAFRAAGGEQFSYIPALNASTEHVHALADLLAKHAGEWFTATLADEPPALTQTRARALGAVR